MLFSRSAGRSFDLILSNPPFFITPKNDFTFAIIPSSLISSAASWSERLPTISTKTATCKCCVNGRR